MKKIDPGQRQRGQELVQLSRFLSYVLRHNPGAIGLQLDSHGWADVEALLAAAARAGKQMDEDTLREVVASNDKQRFVLSEDGKRIRASHGHSIPVDLGLNPVRPPDILYHGTAKRRLPAIREKGLLRGRRQFVHLSPDRQTAVKVGRRHGKAVVLRIRAREMHDDGFQFYLSQSGVWLTRHVPVKYIDFPREETR